MAARIAAGPVRYILARGKLAQDGGRGRRRDHCMAGGSAPSPSCGTLEPRPPPVADDAAEQKHIIFDPIPRLAGIEPSDDPLLELRAAIYLLSGRKRRTA